MLWIKRNLFFVAGAAVALVLMGLAVFFLVSNIQKNGEVQEELNQRVAELKRLQMADPFPSSENIALAEADQRRIREFLESARKTISPVPAQTNLNDEAFKVLLLRSISELQSQAASAGVQLPADFNFSFSQQKRLLTFAPGSIPPLVEQLEEIKAISGILFAGGIGALEAVRRVPVSRDDPQTGPGQEYVARPMRTNDLVVLAPYEVTFRAFTPQLAAVLEGFLQSPYAFVIQSIRTEPLQPAGAATPGGRPAPPARNRPPLTVVDENPITITLVIEAARLAPPQSS
jgi:hypothetical protein